MSSGAWCLYGGQNLHQVPPCPQAWAQSPRNPREAVTVPRVCALGDGGLRPGASAGEGQHRLMSSVSSRHSGDPACP